jgi:hypothetical protein
MNFMAWNHSAFLVEASEKAVLSHKPKSLFKLKCSSGLVVDFHFSH